MLYNTNPIAITNTEGTGIGQLTITCPGTQLPSGTHDGAGTGANWTGGLPQGIVGPEGVDKASIESLWSSDTTTVTFSGLKAGWYSLDLLSARGNGATNGEMTLNTTAQSVSYYTLAGTSPWSDVTTVQNVTSIDPFGAGKGKAVYASFEKFYVAEGGSFTLNLTAPTAALNYMSLSRLSIPEPSSATLSLLALAGFLARRTRKHAH